MQYIRQEKKKEIPLLRRREVTLPLNLGPTALRDMRTAGNRTCMTSQYVNPELWPFLQAE